MNFRSSNFRCVCVFVGAYVRGCMCVLVCAWVKHRRACTPLLPVAMGTCLILIDSLCICLFAFIRALFNLLSESFKCGDINTEVWGVFCDFVLNDEQWGCVQGCAPINKLRTRNPVIGAVHCGLPTKIALAMMSEQVAEGENGVQLASIWDQNELLEGLWRGLWDEEPRLRWPKWPQGHFPQFRSSILGSFLSSFWKTLTLKQHRKNEVCFRCGFWSEIWLKSVGFGYQIRTKWRWYFTISSEMRKVDFWTRVLVFGRILVFSKILRSLILEAKINFETKLERDMNFGWIGDRFWHHKSFGIGLKIHSKTRLDTMSFLEPFLGCLEGA